MINDTTRIEECYTFNLIDPPSNYIYFCLFIIGAILAIVGNTISLIVLCQPQMRSKSNKILTSLALSDALVGYVVFPYIAYQMFYTQDFRDCRFEYVQSFVVYSNIGVSALSVSLIGYDRYILLTKVWNYESIVTKTKVNTLIIFTWSIPFALMTVDIIGKLMDLMKLYLAIRVVLGFLIISVLVIIVVLYFLITRAIHNAGKSVAGEKNINRHSRRNHIRSARLAKKVCIIIACYIFCFLPGLGAIIIFATVPGKTLITSTSLQQFCLFALFLACFNSCLNPIIYTMKYGKFRRNVIKMLYRVTGIELFHVNVSRDSMDE